MNSPIAPKSRVINPQLYWLKEEGLSVVYMRANRYMAGRFWKPESHRRA